MLRALKNALEGLDIKYLAFRSRGSGQRRLPVWEVVIEFLNLDSTLRFKLEAGFRMWALHFGLGLCQNHIESTILRHKLI